MIVFRFFPVNFMASQKKGVKRELENGESKPKKRLKCDFCEAIFEKAKHLKRHRRKHTGETFDCPQCDKSFYRADHLRRHEQTHSTIRAFKCEFPGCNSSYKTKSHLERHKKSHNKEKKKFKCEECGLEFTKKKQLKKHKGSEHGALPFPCIHCDEQFTRPQDRKKHVKAVHAEPSMKCDDCGQMFRWFRELNEHRQLFHQNTCRICNRVFTAKQFLLLHYEVHYNCQDCDYVATSAEEAVLHFQETSHGQPQFYCTFPGCNRKFKHKRNRDSHVRSHSLPFQCDECDARYRNKKTLDKHKKTHIMGPINLNCDICGLKCETIQGLGVHKTFKHNPVKTLRHKISVKRIG